MIRLDDYRKPKYNSYDEATYLSNGREFTLLRITNGDGSHSISLRYVNKFGKSIKLIDIDPTNQEHQYRVYIAGGLHDSYSWYNKRAREMFGDKEELMPDYLPKRKMNTPQSILYDLLNKKTFERLFGKELYDTVYGEQ